MTLWLTILVAALLVGLIILAFIVEAQHRDIDRLDAEIVALTEVAYDHKDNITRVVDIIYDMNTPDMDSDLTAPDVPDEPDHMGDHQ